MTDPQDMIIPMLKAIGDDMNKRFDDVAKRFDAVDARLDKLEAAQKNFRHALTADSMMSKFITGDFEERIVALERKVETLREDR